MNYKANFIQTNQKLQVGDYLLGSLMEGQKPPNQPPNSGNNAMPNFGNFPHWAAIIVPNKKLFLKLALKAFTLPFTAATSAPMSKPYAEKIMGTYTHTNGQVSKTSYYLVISWMREDSLEKHWPIILKFAKNLQRVSGEESIAVIRDGILTLVREWS